MSELAEVMDKHKNYVLLAGSILNSLKIPASMQSTPTRTIYGLSNTARIALQQLEDRHINSPIYGDTHGQNVYELMRYEYVEKKARIICGTDVYFPSLVHLCYSSLSYDEQKKQQKTVWCRNAISKINEELRHAKLQSIIVKYSICGMGISMGVTTMMRALCQDLSTRYEAIPCVYKKRDHSEYSRIDSSYI